MHTVTAKEAAKIKSVSVTTIRNWIRAGKLQADRSVRPMVVVINDNFRFIEVQAKNKKRKAKKHKKSATKACVKHSSNTELPNSPLPSDQLEQVVPLQQTTSVEIEDNQPTTSPAVITQPPTGNQHFDSMVQQELKASAVFDGSNQIPQPNDNPNLPILCTYSILEAAGTVIWQLTLQGMVQALEVYVQQRRRRPHRAGRYLT